MLALRIQTLFGSLDNMVCYRYQPLQKGFLTLWIPDLLTPVCTTVLLTPRYHACWYRDSMLAGIWIPGLLVSGFHACWYLDSMLAGIWIPGLLVSGVQASWHLDSRLTSIWIPGFLASGFQASLHFEYQGKLASTQGY